MYQPQPLNTDNINLPEPLEELLEYLARNTHEVWAAQRIKDGWQYGDERNDKERLHPCLVAYEDLPEAEKEYDRGTARQVLKVILATGFSIKRQS